MRTYWLMLLILPGMSAGEESVIHRCAQEDGTVAFQELPCAAAAHDNSENAQREIDETVPADEFFGFANPFDEAQEAPASPYPEPSKPPSQGRAECQKMTRDAIDEIDLKMRKGYSKEQGQQFLVELLELTEQLRACKKL